MPALLIAEHEIAASPKGSPFANVEREIREKAFVGAVRA